MAKKPFGCLTISGLSAAILTALVVLAIWLARGGILFSPGQLNAKTGSALGGVSSHASLSSNCSACHAAFWEKATMADHCEICHADIATQRQDASTLHGNLLKNNPGLTCRNCHPDHRGPTAVLTDLSKVNFSHAALGYSLKAHQRQTDGSSFSCVTCHGNGYIRFDQAVCINCHEQIKADFMQVHRQAYGDNCLTCHDGIDSYGHSFNHDTVTFHLTGKHAQVDCGGCHSGARSIADLKATPQTCGACHAKNDIHNGKFGNTCGACHSTSGWRPAKFDHALSKFPLTGAHARADCTECHKIDVFVGLPTTCFACHAQIDFHKGLFGSSCEICHSTVAWLPPTFDHASSKFPLTGAHAGVTCIQCHVDGNFTSLSMVCGSCHARNDPHKGQFTSDCSTCHTTSAWIPSTFNHALSVFPLTGAHAGLPCTRCHVNGVFVGLATACAGCHADPAFHAGLFAGTACNVCHNTSAWTPAIYNGPHPGGCDGNCIHHGGASCRDCHTVNLMTATCRKCHDSNNPGN